MHQISKDSDKLELILKVQGIYYLLTGIWPFLHLPSFLLVTGPKTDIWLVKTVGALIIVLGLVLFFAAIINIINEPVLLLALSSTLAFTLIEIYYVATGTISWVYLMDAVVELLIFILLLVNILKNLK